MIQELGHRIYRGAPDASGTGGGSIPPKSELSSDPEITFLPATIFIMNRLSAMGMANPTPFASSLDGYLRFAALNPDCHIKAVGLTFSSTPQGVYQNTLDVETLLDVPTHDEGLNSELVAKIRDEIYPAFASPNSNSDYVVHTVRGDNRFAMSPLSQRH